VCEPLGRVVIDYDQLALDLANAFPGHSPALLLRGQPLDEAAGSAGQRRDPAAVGMNFVNATERFATGGFDARVAQVR
jgi:hypothetical protein